MKRFAKIVVYLISTKFLIFLPVYAFELGKNIQVHGYGHIGYNSANNAEALSNESDHNDIALLFTGSINTQSRAWLQFYQLNGEARVDWAFVDYIFSNNLTLKLGQIKLPFGFYNDYRDVEYIRPSSTKPFLYRDASEIIPEAYQGVGYSFQLPVTAGKITMDLFAGQIVDFEDDERSRIFFGGRTTYQSVIPSLSFIISAFRNAIEMDGQSDNSFVILFSTEYVENKIDLKFEIAHHDLFQTSTITYYTQIAYAFNNQWQPYIRYDYIVTDRHNRNNPSYYQQSNTVGIGYTINQYFGTRLEHHFYDGYALAMEPGDIKTDLPNKNWSITEISLNFIF